MTYKISETVKAIMEGWTFRELAYRNSHFTLLNDTESIPAGMYECRRFEGENAIFAPVTDNLSVTLSEIAPISELEQALKEGDLIINHLETGYDCKIHGWQENPKCHKCTKLE